MKRLKKIAFAAALAVGLLGAASAQADISWTANWSPSNPEINFGSSKITFTNLVESGYTTTALQPVITTPVTNLFITTSATSGAPDLFSKHYDLSLILKDDNGDLHAMGFGGTLAGSVSKTGASISNVFDDNDVQSWFNPVTGHTFQVDLNGFVPPGSGSNINTSGAIGADITVTAGEVPDNGQVHDTPEPSSLALAGLGMAFTGLVAWRRRRNAAV